MSVDIHSHLLPGVDDGAKTLEKSLELARLAVSEGVTDLILTPHHYNNQYINHREEVITATKQLRVAYQQAGIALSLYPAQEIRIHENLAENILYSGDYLSLDDIGRYYLIEMPTQTVPKYALDVLSELIDEGITPVIAHPERNHVFAKDLRYYYQFIEAGCVGQLTSHSYIGLYGDKLRKISREMIDLNLVHVIASDAHHIKHRPFNMQKAYQQLRDDYNEKVSKRFEENARLILLGQPVNQLTPKKKKRFGLF